MCQGLWRKGTLIKRLGVGWGGGLCFVGFFGVFWGVVCVVFFLFFCGGVFLGGGVGGVFVFGGGGFWGGCFICCFWFFLFFLFVGWIFLGFGGGFLGVVLVWGESKPLKTATQIHRPGRDGAITTGGGGGLRRIKERGRD